MAIWRGLALVGGMSVVMGACGSLIDGTSQDIVVNTTPSGATCAVEREGARVGAVLATPGTVTVRRTRHDLTFRCTLAGYREAAYINRSGLSRMALPGLVLTAGVSTAVDAASGADNDYEPVVNLTLPAITASAPAAAAPAGAGATVPGASRPGTLDAQLATGGRPASAATGPAVRAVPVPPVTRTTLAPQTTLAPPAPRPPLTGPAARFVGRTLYSFAYGVAEWTDYFAPDGRAFRLMNGCLHVGTWRGGEGQWCLAFPSLGGETCYTVAGTEAQPLFRDVAGGKTTPVVMTRLVVAGNPDGLGTDPGHCPRDAAGSQGRS